MAGDRKRVTILLDEFPKLIAVFGTMGTFLLVILYLWLDTLVIGEGSVWFDLREFFQAFITNIAPVFIVSAFSYLIFRHVESIRSEHLRDENVDIITAKLKSTVMDELGADLKKVSEVDSRLVQLFARIGVIDEHREIQELDSAVAVYEYVCKRLEQAVNVDDLTWGEYQGAEASGFEEQAYTKYINSITEAVSRPNVKYREVITFANQRRVQRAEVMIKHNSYGYQLGYYDYHQADSPPLLQFMVIDREVIFAFYRGSRLPSGQGLHVVVRHPVIVDLFKDYYETIWQGAKKIKEPGNLTYDEIRQRIHKIWQVYRASNDRQKTVRPERQRKAPSVPKDEATLLLKINDGVPSDIQERYDELIRKRQAETLTTDEYRELLTLTDQVEKLEAQRVEYLADLARLRGVPLVQLMEALGIQPPTHA